uniref:Uncharacterized protein n=1 Tax=Trypanosoma vivax (strain Y486) TaxID=1055687 RepID=G0U0I5_TRYVY|nr:conserved hypothetical protein [Trypanosoma vivax Y486]
MSRPFFTTNPHRIARLQENYDAGVEREKIPPEVREQLDLRAIAITPAKLRFLHQNAMESYSPMEKNAAVARYNELHMSTP